MAQGKGEEFSSLDRMVNGDPKRERERKAKEKKEEK